MQSSTIGCSRPALPSEAVRHYGYINPALPPEHFDQIHDLFIKP
jgi:hypothetical protein